MTTRLLNFYGLALATLAFALLLFAAGILASSLTVAGVAVILAGVLAIASYRINQRVKVRSTPLPMKLPDHVPLPFVARYRTAPWGQLLGVIVLFGGVAVLLSQEMPIIASFSGVLAAVGIAAALSYVRRRGTPALIIDEQGVRSPRYGVIPWDEVDRAYLQTMPLDGQPINNLIFEVYEPNKYLRRDNAATRLIRRMDLAGEKNRVGIRVDFLTSDPRYVEAVVNHVRRQHAASIGVTLKTGDSSIDKRLTEIEKLTASLEAENDFAKQQRIADKIVALGNETRTELLRDTKNLATAARVWVWAVGMVFALFIAALFVRW